MSSFSDKNRNLLNSKHNFKYEFKQVKVEGVNKIFLNNKIK